MATMCHIYIMTFNLTQASKAETDNWSQDTEYGNTGIIMSSGLQLMIIFIMLFNRLVYVLSENTHQIS